MSSPVLTAPDIASGFFPRERTGVSLLFLANGFAVGAWAPKIPEFAERLVLNPGALGLMILVLGVGSLCFMPVAGAMIARIGSHRVAKGMAIGLIPALPLLTHVDAIWEAAIAIFLFGGFMGAMDVAMNANAVEVEKRMRRAIMSSCHAFWSLGGLFGAASGGLLIERFGVVAHAWVACAAIVVTLLVAWSMVYPDAPHPREAGGKRGLPMQLLPWLIGIVALFSMVPEGTVLDWGALYVRRELGASVALSGLAFAGFSGTMALMRFLGDLVRDRFGAVATLRASTTIALIGMLVAGFAPTAEIAIAGFALCGIGIANMVPIAFSAAGNMPGLAPGIGLSVATFLGYSGMLFAPSMIGFAAEHFGFRPTFLAVPVLFVVVLLLSPLARHADRIKEG